MRSPILKMELLSLIILESTWVKETWKIFRRGGNLSCIAYSPSYFNRMELKWIPIEMIYIETVAFTAQENITVPCHKQKMSTDTLYINSNRSFWIEGRETNKLEHFKQ